MSRPVCARASFTAALVAAACWLLVSGPGAGLRTWLTPVSAVGGHMLNGGMAFDPVTGNIFVFDGGACGQIVFTAADAVRWKRARDLGPMASR